MYSRGKSLSDMAIYDITIVTHCFCKRILLWVIDGP